MSIRAIIFDLGGVLLRTAQPEVREALAARYGMSREALEQMVFWGVKGDGLAQRGTIAVDRHWEDLSQALHMTLEESSVFQETFWSADQVDNGLVDFIRTLHNKYKTALLSNAFSDLRFTLTERWKFADAFDVIVISSEVGLIKPDPRIYQLLLERLQVAPQEAVFVDDFIANVEGAQAIGMHAIQFQNSFQVQEDLSRLLNHTGNTSG